ncbi:MAG TPA: type II CAAX endopeptidase family protein [Clostridia bacterium]|nr:type II CAAX endopeptidase family protein [Clostridia bacterium]
MKQQPLTQKSSVIIYALGFIIMLVASIIATTVIPNDTNFYIYICYIIPQLAYLTAIISYTRYAKLDFKLNIKENVHKNNLKYLIAILVGGGIFFSALLPNYFLVKLYAILDFDMQVAVPALNGNIDYLLSLITICILPPICEELMFRKALVDGFSLLGTISAILLSALLFSLSHLNPVQTIYQFILGVILALIYIKTKDILITIIIHVVNNLLAFFLGALTSAVIWEQMKVLLLCIFIGLPVAVLGLLLILKGGTVNTKKQEKLHPFTIILLAIMLLLCVLNVVLI